MSTNKWKIAGTILTIVGALTGIFTSVVADKRMEEEIDEAVERRLNEKSSKEEEES